VLVWLFIILSFTQSGSLQRKLYIEFDSINATSFGQGYMVIGVRAPSDLGRRVGCNDFLARKNYAMLAGRLLPPSPPSSYAYVYGPYFSIFWGVYVFSFGACM